MPGLLGAFGIKNINEEQVKKSINLNEICSEKCFNEKEILICLTSLRKEDHKFPYYEDSKYVIAIIGEIINFSSTIKWPELIDIYESNSFSKFSDFSGNFGILIYEKNNRITIVTDHLGVYPLYYLHDKSTFVFSTSISTFTRIPHETKFNEKWLHEFLYYNYPISTQSLLNDIERIPAASILEFDLTNNKTNLIKYSSMLKKSENLLLGQEALEYCQNIISKKIQKYFEGDKPVLSALSAGLDTRFIISQIPSNSKVELYTFGVKGTPDLKNASRIAKYINLPHTKIYFDNNFLEKLPNSMYETVRFSGGEQSIKRSHLLFAYTSLCEHYHDFPIILSGVSGNQVFRGKISFPSVISYDVKDTFVDGKFHLNFNFFSKMLVRYDDFSDYINQTYNELSSTLGNLQDPESQLNYISYILIPRYFGGEAAIANNYTFFRIPYWDVDILKLAYETEFSNLSFSEFQSGKIKGYKREIMLANQIYHSKIKKLKNISLRGIPISVITKDNKNLFKLHKIKRIINFYRKKHQPPLENWSLWFKTTLKKEIDFLLKKDTRLLQYVKKDFIDDAIDTNNTYWISKFASTEIILRLIENKWNKLQRRN